MTKIQQFLADLPEEDVYKRQAYTRKGYYPYQRVFNVGFRVIIED